MRILIADDHEHMRHGLRCMLETHDGWRVCGEAENGAQAIQKAAELRPDVIVLDLSMPVMDGLTAAREILKTSPAVPIVMHTLYDSQLLHERAAAIGIRHVSAKGETVELLSAVERLLDSKAA